MNIKRQIFEFIIDTQQRWGYMPNQADVHKAFGNLASDVDLHLEQLAREGLLLLGVNNKGEPGEGYIAVLPTFPHTQRIQIRRGFFSETKPDLLGSLHGGITLDLRGIGVSLESDMEAMVVSDDAMTDAGLRPGDVAILSCRSPQRGDIVAVERADVLVLRRYVIVARIPHLLAENPVRPELLPAYDQVFGGVLWGLIRTERPGQYPVASPGKVNYATDGGMQIERKFALMAKNGDLLRRGQAVRGPKNRVKATKKPKRPRSHKPLPKIEVDGDQAWPSPPSGVGLNDGKSSVYASGRERTICDEQPETAYHRVYSNAINNLAARRSHQTK